MEHSDCIFCKITKKEIPAEIVWEDERFMAFKDITPKAPIHVLIVPKRHIPTLRDVSAEDAAMMSEVVAVANLLMSESHLGQKDYRLIVNCGKGVGQAVFHIHFHLLAGKMFRF